MARHTHITRRDVPLCDFCCREGVTTRFPCSTTITMVAADGSVSTSDDDWAACEACAPLVAAGDPKRLAEWVLGRAVGPGVEVLRSVPSLRVDVLASLVDMYSRLLPTLGAPVPCEGFGGVANAGVTIEVVEDDDE